MVDIVILEAQYRNNKPELMRMGFILSKEDRQIGEDFSGISLEGIAQER